jgi:hypothetical protein
VTPTSSAYTLDRWRLGVSQASRLSVQQVSTAPSGFTNSTRITVVSAFTPGSSDEFWFQQRIEGFNVADLAFGTASASSVAVSFWVNSSVAGTYSASLQNSATNYSYVGTVTINAANTWEYKTLTINGAPAGTWVTDNGVGLYLSIDLGSGSSLNTTAGAWQSGYFRRTSGSVTFVSNASATFTITGVQLEKGTQATSFDYRPYGTEEQLCQRYYRITGQGSIAVVRAATQVVHGSSYQNMRAAPTATLLTTSPVFYNFATAANITGSSSSIADSSLGVGACQINIGGFTGLTAGQAAAGVTTAIAGLNSEL